MRREARWYGIRWVGIALSGVMLSAASGWTAPRDQVNLFLSLNERGSANVALQFDFPPPHSLAFGRCVGQALGGRLQRTHWETDGATSTLFGTCDDAFYWRGCSVEGRIDPEPIARLLRPLGVQWLTVNIDHPRAGFSHCPRAQRAAAEHPSSIAHFYPVPVGTGSPPLHFAFGYRRADLLRGFAPLLGLLLLSIGLTFRVRWAALRAHDADPTALWFGYWRFRRALTNGLLLVWLAAFLLLPAETIIRFVLGGMPAMIRLPIEVGVALLPPLLVTAACTLFLYPVFARARQSEWTQADIARQSLWSLAAKLIPFLLLFAMVGALFDNELRAAVLSGAAAFLSRILFMRGWVKSLGLTLNALTVGELRDRIFALAQKAGVKVQQIYVLPAGKSRMANAFAMRGNNLLLTDYLLQHLDKREADAIVGHELAHLKRGDPRKLGLSVALSVALPLGLYLGVAGGMEFALWRPLLPALAALGLIVFYSLARRFERGADAGAVALTGDPAALITALSRITRLNQMPLQWGKWEERLLTHPSTLRRAQAIARHGGISPERLEELLGAPGADADRYELPLAIAGAEKLFSTAFKSGVRSRSSWTLVAAMVLTPALVAHLALLEHWDGIARVAAYGVGLAATLALYLVAGNYAPLWGYRTLQRRLRDRLEREGLLMEAPGAVFVGYAPAPAPRLYEGFSDWDVGFLFIEAGRLCYVGEQTRFALRLDQVVTAKLGPGTPSWWRAPRLYVNWRDEARATCGTFSLRPVDARSMWQLGRHARTLAKELQAWHQHPPASATTTLSLAALEPPDVGEVTCASPSAVLSLRAFARSFEILVALAVGVSILLRLPFDPDQGGAAWYVIAVTAVASIFQWWPYLIYREPDPAKSTPPIPPGRET